MPEDHNKGTPIAPGFRSYVEQLAAHMAWSEGENLYALTGEQRDRYERLARAALAWKRGRERV
jgi:ATP phosphoribosyltransferase regulatory subunit HisZ